MIVLKKFLNSFLNRFREKPVYRVFSGQKYFFTALIFIAVLPLIVSGNILLLLRANAHWFQDPDAFTYIVFFSASIFTMGLALTPTTFIAIISGHFWGWMGLPGVIIGYAFAAVLGYAAGNRLNHLLPEKKLVELDELKPFRENIQKHELEMIIYGRLSPVLPFAMMNFAFSALKPSYNKFIFGSLIGMFPRTLVFFIAGMQASNIWAFLLNPSLRGGLELIPLLLIIISTFGIIRLMLKVGRKA